MIALTSKGFRPFFLCAGVSAPLLMGLWLSALSGGLGPRGLLQGTVWHAHEMIFGYTVAVIAGFLLTAVENWTGRPTLRGLPLLAVCLVWVCARVALLVPGWGGPVLDLLFLPLVAVGIARPLYATGNTRNYPFPVLLGALWACDLAVFLAAAGWLPGMELAAVRVAVYLVAVVILVVSGRIVPAFTGNATSPEGIRRSPLLDKVAVGATLGVAALSAGSPSPFLGVAALVAGAATLLRARSWGASKTLRDPLLWVLHLGHALVGIGLLASAAQGFGVALGTAPLHLVTVGGIGVLTLGMMVRVSLGHTGRALVVGPAMTGAFLCLVLATGARAVGPWLSPASTATWWHIAGGLWILAFASFVVRFAWVLVQPRPDGAPG